MVTREWKEEVVRLHTDPKWGSEYWQNFLKDSGRSVQSIIDEPLTLQAAAPHTFRTRPIEYFIPRKVLESKERLILGETSGFSGSPIVTAFSEKELHDGFVAPFIEMAEKVGFPLNGSWLWCGPNGPHIVGKALYAILKHCNERDPFSIDFDPRWFRTQVRDSLSQKRYFKHLCDQIEAITAIQKIDIIYAPPSIVGFLAEAMPSEERQKIRGVHYCGVAISYEEYVRFHEAFPNASHMSGYGNSLFGMFAEESFDQEGISHYVHSNRVQLDLVNRTRDSFTPCEIGERAQVLFSRYDETYLIINMLERDHAIKTVSGIKDPSPIERSSHVKVIY